jgi:hypothetical protein
MHQEVSGFVHCQQIVVAVQYIDLHEGFVSTRPGRVSTHLPHSIYESFEVVRHEV